MSNAQEYLVIFAVFTIGWIALSILNKLCRGLFSSKRNHHLDFPSTKNLQDYVNGSSGIITGPASLLSYETHKDMDDD